MASESKNQPFRRRPRPPKLEQIVIQLSSSDSDSSCESLESDLNEEDLVVDSQLITQRGLASYASLCSPQKNLPKSPKEVYLPALNKITPSGKLLYMIEEANSDAGLQKHNTTLNETFIHQEMANQTQISIKRKKPERISPLKSVVSQSRLSQRARSEKMNRQKSFMAPLRMLPGPDPLPCRPLKHHHDDIEIKKSYYDTYSYDNSEIQPVYDREFSFDFNDFLYDDSKEPTYQNAPHLTNSNYRFISKRNYNKICQLLKDRISEIREEADEEDTIGQIHVQTLMPQITPFENRIPKRQTQIEMTNYIRNELGKENGSSLKTRSKLFDDGSSIRSSRKGNKKAADDEEEVTPTQLAIVDCLLRNGLSLSLKAHFLDQLPDLDSLRKTLLYLNISFNNFSELPEEILNMYQLEVLKMRNNPVKHLTDKLINLQNLKFLNISYCQLNEMPLCIFELENLIHLDVSYNRIPNIDADIVKLRKLKTLNYEGNEIECLPGCMLKMKRLENINVKNNYLHPLIWRKLITNQVPSLFAISAARVEELFGEDSRELDTLDHKYNFQTSEVQDKLRGTLTRCDCCIGKRYDDGLKLIRPCLKVFGVKYLPFFFNSCSPKCFIAFKTYPNCQ